MSEIEPEPGSPLVSLPTGFIRHCVLRIESKSGLRIDFEGGVSSEIHEEDFVRSLMMKTFAGAGISTLEAHKRLYLGDPKQVANLRRRVDSMLLDGLATTKDWDETKRQVLARRGPDASFFLALGSGLLNGRKTTWSAVEIFVLKAWREIFITGTPLPGLREWSPKAGTNFLQYLGKLPGGDKAAYTKTIQRLGLAKAPVKVRDFIVSDCGEIAKVILKTGTKILLKVS